MKKIITLLIVTVFIISCQKQSSKEPTSSIIPTDVVLEDTVKDQETLRKGWGKPVKGSIPTILIDFDGYYVENTLWNTNGPINATASGLGANSINQIVSKVAAYYSQFGSAIIVTINESIYNKAPCNKKTRVVVTANYQWYSSNYGGVAYINSWTWCDNTPCFVFNTLYGNNIEYIAHAIAHEAGHTIGLRHHSDYNESCIKINEYHPGCIMGQWAGYPSVFDIGPNSLGCNIIVDEAEFIKSKL